MASVSAIVKGVGRVFFPDTMTEKEIADTLAAKGQELLDMSTTARLARAKQQGFKTSEVLFRGSETAEDTARPFVHTSKNPEVANSFGGFVQAAEELGIPQIPLEGGNVAQLVDRATNTATMADIKELVPNTRVVQDAFPELQRLGFDSFEDSGQRVIFNPEDIRSVNAAFDPLRSKSANLLASAAPVAVGLGALGQTDESQAGVLGNALKAAHPNLSISLTERGNNIILDKIVVPKTERSTGQGSRFMNDLLKAADEQGKTVGLSPSTDFGGTKSGLNKFYKKFGFVPNKGKNKNFEISESLVREPKALIGGAAAVGASTSQAQGILQGPGDLSDKITAEEFPKLQSTADFLDKWGQTPLGPAFGGISEYLRGFGRDMDAKQRAKAAFIAALDVI